MNKVRETVVSVAAPVDKNVIWVDISGEQPIQKVFLNGEWQNFSGGSVPTNVMTKVADPHNGNILTTDASGQAVDSGYDASSFLATPSTTGQEGEVLSVDNDGNPIWTTITPTGTADTEMSDSSTNAVQNKVIKEYVDGNYARKDGYYSQMTVGAAETLVGETVDSDAYLIRPTGGESNEVANSVASVLGMEGNSCVWNQLAQVPNNSFVKSKVTIANGKMTFVSDGTSTIRYEVFYKQTKSFNIIIGHHYYIAATLELNFNGGTPFPIGVAIAGDTTELGRLITNKIQSSGRCSGIMQATVVPERTTINNVYFNWSMEDDGSAVAGATFSAGDIVVIDLTLLGIDNLTTTDQVEAWLAEHVGTKPYYAYNACTILSAQTLGIKTYGQNLLNPTTRQARLIPYDWEENSNVYTIKNIPSGATATFTPDATGVAVTVDISGGSLDITSYGRGVLELSAATADTYVCMKWDEDKDDDVVPYEEHTQNFDVRKVYGKVNGAGEYVQCFPNGLRGIGSVKDTLAAADATKVIGDVDLGSLIYTYSNAYQYFYAEVSGKHQGEVNLLCKRYINTLESFNGNQSNGVIKGGASNSRIFVTDRNYTDPTTFKVSLAGVPLYYELATPITYTDLIYRDGGIDRPLADVLMNIEVNNWSMEEQLMTPYENGNPTSIPATIKTQYGMDAVEAIDTLQKTCYFADDVKANLQALLNCINTNCSETLGGTFSISETATDKVFAFTFTANTEPDVEPTNEGE